VAANQERPDANRAVLLLCESQ